MCNVPVLTKSEFQWLTEEKIQTCKSLIVPNLWNFGNTLKVYLERPEQVYTLHKSYPLVLEKMCITAGILSPL